MRRLALLTGAWVLLAVAINLDGGFYSPRALVALVASYVALIAAVVVPAADPADDTAWGRFAVVLRGALAALADRRRALLWLGLGAAGIGAVAAGVAIGTMGLRPGTDLAEVMGGFAPRAALVAGMGVAVAAAGRSRPGIGWWAAMFGFVTVAFVVTIITHTPSDNDVWFSVTGGSSTFTQGLDLYERCWPGNTDPLTDCVYAYLPLTSVLVAPGLWLLGDIRYAYILAMAIASLAVTRIAPPRIGVLFGFLMAASGFALVQRAWTEPLLLAGIAGAVWAALHGRGRWLLLAMAVVFGTKQHMVLLLPLTTSWPAMRVRGTVISFGVAALLALPWFLAGPAAFIDDTLRFHVTLIARSDSLSVYVLATRGGLAPILQPIAPLLIIVPTVLAELVALWRLPRTTAGFTLGAALVLGTFSVVNKQAFYNHYTLVMGLILLTVALLLRDRTELEPGPVRAAPSAGPPGTP